MVNVCMRSKHVCPCAQVLALAQLSQAEREQRFERFDFYWSFYFVSFACANSAISCATRLRKPAPHAPRAPHALRPPEPAGILSGGGEKYGRIYYTHSPPTVHPFLLGTILLYQALYRYLKQASEGIAMEMLKLA